MTNAAGLLLAPSAVSSQTAGMRSGFVRPNTGNEMLEHVYVVAPAAALRNLARHQTC